MSQTIRANLKTQCFGKYLAHLSRIDSTNQYALERAKQRGRHGEVVIADYQTAGKGRLKRTWHSPPNGNLYFSLLLVPETSPRHFSLLTLMAGVATCRVLRELTQQDIQLKWPNDIYYADRKLGGILCESLIQNGRIKTGVIGIGLNLNAHTSDAPAELMHTAISLQEITHTGWTREQILPDLLLQLEKSYQDLLAGRIDPLIQAANQWHTLQGAAVRAEEEAESCQGTVLQITPAGHLQIQKNDGTLYELKVGDVIRIRKKE